jgi:hypothetical protein
MAHSYVTVTLSSKDDKKLEHIHLLAQNKLTEYFGKASTAKPISDDIPQYLFMIMKVN